MVWRFFVFEKQAYVFHKQITPCLHNQSTNGGRRNEIVNKRAKQNNRIINCLLQVHIASERTKFGFEINEINEVLDESNKLENICIKGLMGMATFTKEKSQLNSEFTKINNLFIKIKNKKISTLSIGMSGDYELAINNGSTMIRIGSTIFGNRNY